MKQTICFLIGVLMLLTSCSDEKRQTRFCEDASESVVSDRSFLMGFSTWNYGIGPESLDDTYDFINANADIYSEQIDYRIPWDALVNGLTLPQEYVSYVDFKKAKRPADQKLLLSFSLLDTDRSDLLEDYNGERPAYDFFDDAHIEDAYYKHLQYLISKMNPDYLVLAMEVNELQIKNPDQWEPYKNLISAVRQRVRQEFPGIPLSESITLHGWIDPETDDQDAYIEELRTYINDSLDFAAISFYPFLKGYNDERSFMKGFDILHERVDIPIAMVETNHLAETLEIETFDLTLKSSLCEQALYLAVLAEEAQSQNYEFIIWWSHRDYDDLWETFPEELKDLGKVWRDTGLLDENGEPRPSYDIWRELLTK